jgi:transposase-like protein
VRGSEEVAWSAKRPVGTRPRSEASLASGQDRKAVDDLLRHFRAPRSTNLLERTFVEVRRRTKIIGRFPGETSPLSLIWAVLELDSRCWRGIKRTPRAVAEIERLRRGRPHAPTEAVAAA